MSDPGSPFTGPLFIVGMPRSGTKLLRGIMNEHPAVAIPEIETEFLPYWIETWKTFGDISDRHLFQRFYESCQSLPFFVYLNDANTPIDADCWYGACAGYSPAAAFEALLRVHLGLKHGDGIIWGDKSPSYLTHLPTLKTLYPRARFVHIIRDVRDYCLSINKAWGKSMLRAAQRWSDDVSFCRASGSTFGSDYLEVRYEDLLQQPAAVISRVCESVGLEFRPDQLNLSAATENIGDAEGIREIVTGNVGKYEHSLNARTRTAIEAIAGRTLTACGYPCNYEGRARRLGPMRLKCLQMADGINLIRFSRRQRGVLGALRFVLRYFAVSGNRRQSGP